jgi:YYY domain-containing protein
VLTLSPHDSARSATLLLDDEDRRRYRSSGTWHELFDPSDLANRFPVPVWVLALLLLGIVAFPYLWLVLRLLPDAGYAVARPVGLLLVAWPAWWLASYDVVEFGRGALAATAGALAAGALAIVVSQRRPLAHWLHARWRLLAVEEAVFWALFAALLTVRWANPDLWHPTLGGEKPMDLAYLNAVVKSASFPPYDPWFAGGYVNYYYFGFVLVGALVELTGIVPHVAYNLAIPTLAAFLGLAAFGAALALARTRRAIPTASLAAAFVVVLGNLGQVEVLLERARGAVPIEWWYWNASRAISVPEGEPGPITEFPAFTYLYADLHAHAIALPYAAVVLVLAAAVARGGLRRGAPATRVGLLAVLALVLGALWPTNTWDVPTYAAVALAALIIGRLAAARERPLRAVAEGAAVWAAVLAAAYVLFLPFHRAYVSSFAGVGRWAGARTSLPDFLTVHGLFLFPIVSYLLLEAVRTPRASSRRRPAALVAAAAVAIALLVAGHGPAGIVVAVGTLAASVAARRGRPPRDRLVIAFVGVGLALVLAVEYLVVSRIDIGRTNTVFKSYLQVWVLWGVAAALSTSLVLERLRHVRRRWAVPWKAAGIVLVGTALLYPALATPAKVGDRFDRSVGRTLDGAAFMARARHSERDTGFPLADDLAGIRWMQANVRGSPVVAEVNTHPRLYGWGNRFAMFTGNPAVVGWDFHQRQQRGVVAGDAIAERIADLAELYGTTSVETAGRLLERYDVEYVVVGPLERAYFPDGEAKWRTGRGRLWETAFAHGDLAIYRVRRP